MANTHRYGFRFLRNLWGGDTPEVVEVPLVSGYSPVENTGSTSVNLNIGDPIILLETGSAQLVESAASGTPAEGTDETYGIVLGVRQVLINGGMRPNAYYPSGTVYGSGFTPYNLRTILKVLPVVGKEFEIDTAAAGGSSLDTYEEWLAAVGAGANFKYSALTSNLANPKANPLLDETTITDTKASTRQLRITGIGRNDDTQDFSLANVTLRVVFTSVQESPFRTASGWDAS